MKKINSSKLGWYLLAMITILFLMTLYRPIGIDRRMDKVIDRLAISRLTDNIIKTLIDYSTNMATNKPLKDIDFSSDITTDNVMKSSVTNTTTDYALKNDSYRFHFRGTYNNEEFIGKKFDVKWNDVLKNLHLFNLTIIDDNTVLKAEPKFVTAFSENHFEEAMRLFNKLYIVYGRTKIIYVYNLGLKSESKGALMKQWSFMIIEFREFKFEKYPDYVSNLFEYRWKPFIIAEMLITLPCFWWVDTSIQSQRQVKTVYTAIQSGTYYPWILPDYAGHSVYATTDKRMSDYLPYPENVMKNYSMYGANLMLIYGTSNVRQQIVRFLVLCALQQDCLAPKDTTIYCKFSEDRYSTFAGCHRYDQSAVNILLAWANNFEINKYTNEADNAFVLL